MEYTIDQPFAIFYGMKSNSLHVAEIYVNAQFLGFLYFKLKFSPLSITAN